MKTAWASIVARRSFPPGILAILLLVAPSSIWASGQVSDCTEQGLLNAITGGGTVTFASNCSITLTAPIIIGPGSTKIDSSGHTVTISGGNSVQLFNVGGNLQLLGLSLINGAHSTGGALYINPGATVTASNCTFGGNAAVGANGTAGAAGADKAYGFGGNGGDGSPGIPGFGGAIYNLGSLKLLSCVLATNTAVGGNGGPGGTGGSVDGAIGQGGNGGIGGSGGFGCGGAVYNLGALFLANCTISANSAVGGSGTNGGAGGTSRTLSTNGTGIFPGLIGPGGAGVAGAGGGVYNGASAVVVGCTFSLNTARGGVGATGGNQVNGVGSTGSVGGDGSGGAFCNALNAALTNSTFFSNVVAGGTGGTGGGGTGVLSTEGDGGDGGNGNGGSVFNSGTLSIVNCTLSTGGAIGGTNGVAGTGTFAGSPGNPGSANGGNIASLSGTVVLRNSIVANNVSGSNGYGNITDGGYNLSSDHSLTLTATGSGTGVAPKLGPLANNGGPTLTMALLSGSPAIDRISLNSFFPATDQRGFQRPVGNRADVGAYEAGSTGTSGTTNLLSIAQPTLSSNRINIVVPTQSGRSYILQFKNDLTNATWLPLSTNAGTGGLVTNQDLTTNQPGRFYRVMVQ